MTPVEQIHGRAIPLGRKNVDTDVIIAARHLKTIVRAGLGRHAFETVRTEPGNVFDDPRFAGAPILIAGDNFGCGSSREHAPWALQDYGFRAVVSASFADIFFSNCTKIGLLPVLLPEGDVRALMAAGEAEIDLEAQEVRFDGRAVGFDIDPEIRHRLLNGLDDIALTLQQADAIDAYERAEPRRYALGAGERPGPDTSRL